MIAIVDGATGEFVVSENDTHATPDSGQSKIYAKTDGQWYSKDDASTETQLSNRAILSGAIAPSSTPSALGDIYINTAVPDVYIAAGTSSSADWKKVT